MCKRCHWFKNGTQPHQVTEGEVGSGWRHAGCGLGDLQVSRSKAEEIFEAKMFVSQARSVHSSSQIWLPFACQRAL